MMLYVARVRRAGFTLIEIMIVIVIIAILAGIVVPNIKAAKNEAHREACFENCENIINAISVCLTRKSEGQLCKSLRSYGCSAGQSNGRWWIYANNGTAFQRYLVENGYLGSVLLCPHTGGGYFLTCEYKYSIYSDSAMKKCIGTKTGWFCACMSGHNDGDGAKKSCPTYAMGVGRCYYYNGYW